MRAIVCLDSNNGMFFNNRRQSQDRVVIKDILHMIKGKTLWMTEYSYNLFEKNKADVKISENFFEDAKEEDFCFLENCYLNESKVEQLIVYRWDKVYPADIKLKLNHWKQVGVLEFQGYSHEKIRKEIYVKYEK